MNNKMLQQICRTCLATCGELVPIFSNDYYVHNLPDKLFNTTRIEILQNDDLPKMMCKKCIFLVDSLYCFKDQCEMAEIKLKKTLKGSNSDISLLLNLSPCKDTIQDEHTKGNSDIGTSSEEEYQIEYASEEARLEVENARRRSRDAKKYSNHSGVKVKSVEIVPTLSKDYKNFNSVANYTYEVSVVTDQLNEDSNISDIDEVPSFYIPEQTQLSNNKNIKKNDDETFTTNENVYVNNYKRNYFKNKFGSKKLGLKRKMENDSYGDQLLKVPKKVLFKHSQYGDENLKYIEVAENQDNNSNDSSRKIDDNSKSITEVNLTKNDGEKITENYDSTLDSNSISKSSTNSSPSFELKRSLNQEDRKSLLELRMQNLMQQAVINIPKICVECMKHFNSYEEFLVHKVEIHSIEGQHSYNCLVCCKKYSNNSSLTNHLKVHKDVRLHCCILCAGIFYSTDSIRSHLASHVDLLQLKCQICSKQFMRITRLLHHMKDHNIKTTLTCTMCSNNFNNVQALHHHFKQKHGNIQENAKVKDKESNQSVSREVENKKKNAKLNFSCPYCEQNFIVKDKLREHVFTHIGVQKYSCLVCEKVFDSQEERTEHTQVHMKPQQKNDRKKFRCRICHEILISRVSYGQHLKNKHWNSKQTNEILKELSDSFMNEKVNEKLKKNSTPNATDVKSVK